MSKEPFWYILTSICSLVDCVPRGGKGGGIQGGAAGGGAVAVVVANGEGTKNTNHPFNDPLSTTWADIPIWGWILILLPIVGLISLCVAILAWKLFHQIAHDPDQEANRTNHQRPTTVNNEVSVACPLCERPVSERSWQGGRHRRKCASRRKDSLASWPVYDDDVRCPLCRKRLRNYPANRDYQHISCHRCPNGQAFVGCFPCNYILCDLCARRRRPAAASTDIDDTTAATTHSDRQQPAAVAVTPTRMFAPKTSPFFQQDEPSAPPYEVVIEEDCQDRLPTYEEALLGQYP